ncbi:MAG TPA: hypothetical protein VGK02_09795 [Candidatus Aquicultor sp.]|jgi:hypothetical protein
MRATDQVTEIATRVFTAYEKPALRAQDTKRKKKHDDKKLIPFGQRVLVFDTETTTDFYQNLKFGSARVYQFEQAGGLYNRYKGNLLKVLEDGLNLHDHWHDDFVLAYEVIFYGEGIEVDELCILETYAQEHGIRLISRAEFIDILLKEVYELGTICAGFNLPFDLSRIALSARSHTRGQYKEYISLTLRDDIFTPELAIRNLDSKKAFIQFKKPAKSRDAVPYFRGHFLDLRTLIFALTNGSFSLKKACELFKAGVKLDTKEHGIVTSEYIEYNRQDVEITWQLYRKLIEEYQHHPIGLLPTKAYSPASIGKAYLKAMGIKPFLEKQPDFDKNILGFAMAAYYGGRSECRIRKTMQRVLYTDVVSMYPTVFSLQKLWDWVTAERIEAVEATDEVQEFIDRITLDALFDKDIWTKIPGLVQIIPQGDVLPIRAKYSETYQIGLNKLTMDKPMWYTLADVIVSKLLTGKTPNIVQAFRFIPGTPQAGLKPLSLQGKVKVDPASEDFFKTVIEQRSLVKANMKELGKENPDYAGLSSLQLFLKILANSTSYGIYIELNRNELDETEQVDIYGLEHFPVAVERVEETGFFTNPLTAVMITGASRLILAMIEKSVSDAGLPYVFCDTDSMAMAINNEEELCVARTIVDRFASLNPYNQEIITGSILKIEDENYALKDWSNPKAGLSSDLEPLYCYMVSSKRYVLFNVIDGVPVIRKKSDHGLGHLKNPIKKGFAEDRDSDWVEDIWRFILSEELGFAFDRPSWFDYFAMGQHSVTKPHLYNSFSNINKGKPYCKQIKPFNFMSVWYKDKYDMAEEVTPISPFTEPGSIEDVAEFLVDRKTGNRLYLRTLMRDPFSQHRLLKTYGDVVERYAYHRELKFITDTGESCPEQYKGTLYRTHVKALDVAYIGKEANELEEANVFGVDDTTCCAHINQTREKIIAKAKDIGISNIAAHLINNGISEQVLQKQLKSESCPKQLIGILQIIIAAIEKNKLTKNITVYEIKELHGKYKFDCYYYVPFWNKKGFKLKLLVKQNGEWFFISDNNYAELINKRVIKNPEIKNIIGELIYSNGVITTKLTVFPEHLTLNKAAAVWNINKSIINKSLHEKRFTPSEIKKVDDVLISRLALYRVFGNYTPEKEAIDINKLTVIVRIGGKQFKFPLLDISRFFYRKEKSLGNNKAQLLAEIHNKWYIMQVKDNPLIFKYKLMPRSNEAKMNKPYKNFLQSKITDFPEYVDINYACERWNISKNTFAQNLERARIELANGKISRLDLATYL